jgi:putative ABC transport system ATP-binding protein
MGDAARRGVAVGEATGWRKPGEPVFSLRDVCVEIGGAHVLTALTVDLGDGVTVVSGPSGAGKTTLLRLLVRMIDPSSGHITYQGVPLAGLPAPQLRRDVQMVGQRATLLTGHVADELRVAAPQLPDEQAERLLADVGLDPAVFLPRDTGGLSAGQAHRVCLARSLALRPRVLLLDEPTAHLDPAATSAVEATVRRFAAGGGSVILVSHDTAQITRLGGAALKVEDGRAMP